MERYSQAPPNRHSINASSSASGVSGLWATSVEWENWVKQQKLTDHLTQLTVSVTVRLPVQPVFSADLTELRQWLTGVRAKRQEMTEDFMRTMCDMRAKQRKVDTAVAIMDRRLSEFSEKMAQLAVEEDEDEANESALDDSDETGSPINIPVGSELKRHYPDSPGFLPNKTPRL